MSGLKETFFDQPIGKDIKSYENIKKLQLVKEMIAQLVSYFISLISKKIARW